MYRRLRACTVTLVITILSAGAGAETGATESRLEQLAEANIIGVHAYQIELSRRQGNIDTTCWPQQTPSDSQLQALVAHQASLLATPVESVKAWAQGDNSSFNPQTDLNPLLNSGLALNPALPVSVFTRYLETNAPGHPR